MTAAGLVCIVVGLYQAWPPLAWIVGGAGLISGGVAWRWHELLHTRRDEIRQAKERGYL